jgi:hypothetical protein
MNLKWTQDITTNCDETESTQGWTCASTLDALPTWTSESWSCISIQLGELNNSRAKSLNLYPVTADKSASTLRWQTDVHPVRIFSIALDQSVPSWTAAAADLSHRNSWAKSGSKTVAIENLVFAFGASDTTHVMNSSNPRITLKYCDM